MKTIVQLRAAKIPLIGWIAVHYWYAILRADERIRWEVWQTPDLTAKSWGHLHQNLLPFDAGVGNGGSWIESIWTGEVADRLIDVLENSPETYPHKYKYRYFPGPNSNTYVQWVLDQAQDPFCLSLKGIGRHYGSKVGAADTTW